MSSYPRNCMDYYLFTDP